MHLTLPSKPFRKLPPMLGAVVAAAVVATTPVPAAAQDDAEARLRRAEAEIRALQRAVFPGGDGRFFEPLITQRDGTNTQPNVARPSTSAVTDILARLDAMELQLQRLTALTEENRFAIAAVRSRLDALEAGGAATRTLPTSGAQSGNAASGGPSSGGATRSNIDAMSGAQSSATTTSSSAQPPAATGPSDERLAGVQAITKPQTDDAGDDEYSYGFRLWNAGYYPEARQQLASFVEQYPNHPRITYGRNLLGRAFLDDGQPEEAARWFLRNYQADRTARRAPDSLLYLAESMIAMDDTRRACIALSEFGETYPAVATGRLADQYQANLQKVTCEE
ncbi:tol-pal system YbgF family protein [Erythrobacter sp. SCSIO 43205]|uniref:tetratricopeptide repeat protein n=1 Tax=Erythrobacter sp. SCSIO 43205 TaxID=2779361 RepID=UPI002102ABE0|nr:tetratricopeptide repeat protein [Erythrobacter sp. SCSIO 43205]